MFVRIANSLNPKGVLRPVSDIIAVCPKTRTVQYRPGRGGAVGKGTISSADILRLQTERVPVPAGVTLRGQPVLWVEIGPDDEAFTATLTPAGDIAMHEGDRVMAPEMGDGEAYAAVGGALAAEVPQQGRRRPAGGRRAG